MFLNPDLVEDLWLTRMHALLGRSINDRSELVIAFRELLRVLCTEINRAVESAPNRVHVELVEAAAVHLMEIFRARERAERGPEE